MSELKAFVARKIDDGTCDPVPCVEVYRKSEADKLIAELKSQKAQAEDVCAYWKTMAQKNAADNAEMAKQRAEALKMECHHKYKRCLAMARVCRLRARWFGDNAFYKKEQWALQWHKRWLELAEKFKEVK